MVTPTDIRMCVADVMQNDDIESIESVLGALNSPAGSSWRAARGQDFTSTEVETAIRELLDAGMVTPCAETPPSGDCMPIAADRVDAEFPIGSLWFHLEQSGRDAVRKWWDAEGCVKFPLEQAE